MGENNLFAKLYLVVENTKTTLKELDDVTVYALLCVWVIFLLD